jgi:hypothetical protein
LYDFIITLDFDTAGAFTKAINIQPLFKEFEHFKNIINLNLDKRCVDDNSIMGALLTQLVYLLPKERRYKIDSPNLDVDWFAETFDDISIVFTEKYSDSIEALHKRGMHLATGNSMTPTWSAALLNAAPTIMLCHMFPKKAKDLIQGYEIYLKESKEVRWTTIDINKLINALHLHFTYKLKE